jgi:pre-mRNA-processing factor SLU7
MAEKLTNPHIPEFMAKAPFYAGGGGGDMAHQRKEDSETLKTVGSEAKGWGFTAYYKRGQFAQQATKYRAGACKNCGAMTHSEKDCVERPRKRGAAKTGEDIRPDEFIITSGAADYDAKRDRYNGYDVEEHKRTIEKYAAAEVERKRLRAEEKTREEEERKKKKEEEKLRKQEEKDVKKAAKAAAAGEEKQDGQVDDDDKTASSAGSGTSSESDTDTDYSSRGSDDDDVRETGHEKLVGKAKRSKMSVMNLRLREDRAKYLINLDVDSAYYDPKSRSMRDNPMPEEKDNMYQGDNAWRADQSVGDFANMQMFAWEAGERGVEVHLQANPTQLELLKRQHAQRKEQLLKAHQQKVTEKYGAVEDMVDNILPKDMLLGQGENYVEYGRDGKVLGSTVPILVPRSSFDEDVYPGHHKSVWGSWYDKSTHTWGYACCHGTHYNSYCTGAAGISANSGSSSLGASTREGTAFETKEPAAPAHVRSSLYGEAEVNPELDPKKLAAAMARYEATQAARKEMGEDGDPDASASAIRATGSKRKRDGYHGVTGTEVATTAEDLEVHRLKRLRADDPMASVVGKSASEYVEGVDD